MRPGGLGPGDEGSFAAPADRCLLRLLGASLIRGSSSPGSIALGRRRWLQLGTFGLKYTSWTDVYIFLTTSTYTGYRREDF